MTRTAMLVSLMPNGVLLKLEMVMRGSKGKYHGSSEPTARSRVSITSNPAPINARRTCEAPDRSPASHHAHADGSKGKGHNAVALVGRGLR